MSWLSTGNVLSLQLDESTDIANDAILLSYARYFYNNKIHEDILFSFKLESTTTRKKIFDTLVNFFTNNNLDFEIVLQQPLMEQRL